MSSFCLPQGRLYSGQNIMKMTFPARQQLDAGRNDHHNVCRRRQRKR
ncbi:hypothetical protein AOX87_06285 [Salmonella enterica subsp. enterica serovar Schwarzengrund]|nr:hypothetical protein AEU02_14835 [Salmonella enterica subsp. enterica serovar Schwarzengrund]KOH82949.1 hypothetical protein AEU18_05850 [Salmonella enterica subsp. enterica serovar Bredeney]KSB56530.1 hypothetical protein LFZ1_09040 [Salmonella enterica subsp. enterica serovar Rubislaw str. SA20030553]OCI35521.1 hypothetical protein BBD25_18420 [Salmonella enterica]KNI72923.1 hypothetical protein AEU22_07050 [Salmonella enterica subsp. enterica serovar Schwarzengrund]